MDMQKIQPSTYTDTTSVASMRAVQRGPQELHLTIPVEKRGNLEQSSYLNENQKLTRAMEEIAESLDIDLTSASISFSKDKDTNLLVIKIIDNETKEVIRQVPPEELVRLKKRLMDLQGLIFDKKV